MSRRLLWLLVLVVVPLSMWPNASANDYERVEVGCMESPSNNSEIVNIGAVIDFNRRVGKEQKIAMEIAIQEVYRLSCYKLALNFSDSHGNPSRARRVAADLANNKQVQVVIGTKLDGGSLVHEIDESSKGVPIISLSSISSPEMMQITLPYFIQVGNNNSLHLKCIAAIVEQFNWRKVTAIYEHDNGFTSYSEILTKLSYSLRLVNSEIDHHVAFPSMTSLLDPIGTIEKELSELKNKSNRVFLVIQSSLEFSTLLFEKAKEMGMMEKGYVWIITDDIASHLDSIDSSVSFNMQGVIGCKTNFIEKSEPFKRFKVIFWRRFGLEYPEEENPHPSMFALRAYDVIWAIAHALRKSQGNFSLEGLAKNILSNNHEGLSGRISFKENRLLESPTFKVVNVIGKSYQELAYWSPITGFLKNLDNHEVMKITTSGDSSSSYARVLLGPVNWPGRLQTVPKGWVYSSEGRPLKIGVPAGNLCPQFVYVNHDQKLNETHITGSSISVFKAVVEHLPYQLPYDFVPFYGSYNQLVEQVYNKVFDAAVGNIQILEHRYVFAEFSTPYIESGIAMIVKVKPAKSKETWMFMGAFTKEMWLLMAVMHLYVALVIWFIDGTDNSEIKQFDSMLWFSVNLVFFAHREPIKSNLARAVLAPWLFAILIVTSSFTANLSSMMTVSQLEPRVPNIETLLRTNGVVGINKKSFLVQYLVEELNFKAENIRGYDSINDFPGAFDNKEIEAAIDIVPHVEIFLATYCTGYIQAGPTLKLGGLGFAFPKNSALSIDISRAILKSIESEEVQRLEDEMLATTNCGSSNSKVQNEKLGHQPFIGLFSICGAIATFALLVTTIHFVRNNAETYMKYIEGTLLQRGLLGVKIIILKHLNKRTGSAPVSPETNPGNNTFDNKEQNIVSIDIELSVNHHS